MKLTRRQLVVAAAAGSVAAANAFAQAGAAASQSAPPTQQPTAADFAKQSQDGVQHNRETLAKFAIPMSTEPAFQFKA